MIVYAGKQYGNNFNNGDEGLFQDANRPRDDDKFKIRPGMQSGKWDWRKSNKNTDASIYTGYGFRQVSNTASLGTGYDFYRLRLKDKFTESDLSAFNGYQQRTKTWTAQEILGYFEDAQKQGNPKTRIIDGDLEILETGTYIVTLFAQFLRPNGHTWNTNSAMGVSLLEKVGSGYVAKGYNMSRSCTDVDAVFLTVGTYIEQGTCIAPGACEGYGNVMVIGGITATRTG